MRILLKVKWLIRLITKRAAPSLWEIFLIEFPVKIFPIPLFLNSFMSGLSLKFYIFSIVPIFSFILT